MWTATWSVQWYITLRMSTWTADGVLRFSCEGLARLQRLAVQHPTATRSSTVTIMRSMTHRLECLWAQCQVPYTYPAKVMPCDSCVEPPCSPLSTPGSFVRVSLASVPPAHTARHATALCLHCWH